MPIFQRIKNTLDWIIRLQGAYTILATIVASSFGTAVRAFLSYKTHLPVLWVTPIWLFSAAVVLVLLLLLARKGLDRPAFVFNLDDTIWSYDEAKEITIFFVGARVLNLGAPSITQNWTAAYKVGSAVEPMKPFYLVGAYVLTVAAEQITFENEDLLNVKTAEVLVPKGAAVYGRLLFTLSGNREGQIKALQHRIEISFQDFLSTSYSASYVPSPTPLTSIARHPHEKTQFLKKTKLDPVVPLPAPVDHNDPS
jgi:hypothetical protein